MKKAGLIFTIISGILAHSGLDAQVQTLTLLPAQPVEGQSVSVIVETVWPSAGCESTGIQINTSSLPDIVVTATHELGFLTVICNHTDTVEIGVLPVSEEISPGEFSQYQLLYTASADGLPQVTDTDTLFFSVLPISTSIDRPEGQPVITQVGGKLFQINTRGNRWDYTICLIDLNGKLVWTGELSLPDSKVDFSTFPAGMYFLNYGSGVLKIQLAD